MQVRGVRPFFSEKYDITRHPRYKYLSDADKKNTFDVDSYLSSLRRKKRRVVTEDELFAILIVTNTWNIVMMNNAPSMEELEARAKAGEQISLLDVAEAAKAEVKKPKQTRKTTQKQKKPSIRAQLAAAKEEQKKRPPAREKSKEMEV